MVEEVQGGAHLMDIKSVIQACLDDPHMRVKVKHLLDKHNLDNSELEPGQLLQILRDEGIIGELLEKIKLTTVSKPAVQKFSQELVGRIEKHKRYLLFQVISGRAFVENMLFEDDGDMLPKPEFYMQVHAFYAGQRFRSKKIPAACDPVFDETFLFELGTDHSSTADLLSVRENLQLCVIKHSSISGKSSLLSSYQYEWRNLLSTAGLTQNVCLELSGTGPENHVTIGLLDCHVELIPRAGSNGITLDPLAGEVVHTQLSLEKSRQAERERLFLTYAKHWWNEYLQVDEDAHTKRLVKIFATDEVGVTRPTPCLISPLRAARAISSPAEAARFVSLLDVNVYTHGGSIGSGDAINSPWNSFHSIVSTRAGDPNSLACLLASLLLGFGLDAYVCLGSRSCGLDDPLSKPLSSHAWVATLGHDRQHVTFWEPATAERFEHVCKRGTSSEADNGDTPAKSKVPFRTIGCIFNAISFYANLQPSDTVSLCSFDLGNGAFWKAISPEALSSVKTGLSPLPPILKEPRFSEVSMIANTLENEMRQGIVEYRNQLGFKETLFDNPLSYALTPALVNFELERCHAVFPTNETFQASVRNLIPSGHTFKGYNCQFNHLNSSRILAACAKATMCQAILACRGDQTRMALRVRVTPYAEGTNSVWVMIACRFQALM